METLAFIYGTAAFEDPTSEAEMRSPEELAKISTSAVAGILGSVAMASMLATAPQAQAQSFSALPSAATEAVGTASVAFVSTDGAELRVRSGPSLTSAVTGYLPDGTRVNILSGQGGWSRLSTGGWVSNQFLSSSSAGGGGGSDLYVPGDRGPGVISLQQALAAKGYYSGVIDGVYGTTTTNAVYRFQLDNRLSADGIAGPATLESLLGTSSGGGGGSDTYFPGDSGPGVVSLQQALASAGYYFGPIDGVYSSGTTNAVYRFQLANDLSADGIAGSETLEALTGTGSGGGGGSDIYYPGDSGAGVVSLQQALSTGGFYVGPIDGVYGSGTTNAVYRFQLTSGLVADGVAGPATLNALGI